MTAAAAIDPARGKRRTALSMAMLVVGMLCLGYASVPLYNLFCEVTGFGGTTRKALSTDNPIPVPGKTVSVRFDANHSPGLPWTFAPEKTHETLTIGARDMAFFRAKNLSDKPVKGIASYNVTPTQAGKYFNKIECFCFTEQTLEPGQEVRMPVIFFVDPKILDDPDTNDISEITLSYTFFPVDPEKG